MSQDQTPSVDPTTPADYEPPVIEEIGTVLDLTQGTGSGLLDGTGLLTRRS